MILGLVQADVEEKAMKRREQQAEYDRVHEIYQDRLESLAMDAQDPQTVWHISHTICNKTMPGKWLSSSLRIT